MSRSPYARIAVAVPHGGVDSALRFAAREALLRCCGILVVGPCAQVLAEASRVVEVLTGPGIPVDVRLVRGDDAETVLAGCPEAGLVVVHRSTGLHLLHALSYGAVGASTSTDVACVPPDWYPRPDDRRPVVVGVDDPFHAARLLAQGLAQAELHDTMLTAVHAWQLPCRLEPEEQAALSRLWGAELEARLRRQLRALCDGPGCLVEVHHGAASDTVLTASLDAQLLVLGRNTSAVDHGSHIGRAARSAVWESACPTLLVGADRSRHPFHRPSTPRHGPAPGSERPPEPLGVKSRRASHPRFRR